MIPGIFAFKNVLLFCLSTPEQLWPWGPRSPYLGWVRVREQTLCGDNTSSSQACAQGSPRVLRTPGPCVVSATIPPFPVLFLHLRECQAPFTQSLYQVDVGALPTLIMPGGDRG